LEDPLSSAKKLWPTLLKELGLPDGKF